MKALIVDDASVMRKMLTYICTDAGLRVVCASDGKEALEKLAAEGPFDVALVDWEMPEMNGLDLVREIKDCGRYPGLKLLMVTTHNSMSDVVTAMSLGIDDYLMKPIDEESVLSRLRQLGVLE
jgi:two-component system, chemotaxis family, chemotaxis protein CheY